MCYFKSDVSTTEIAAIISLGLFNDTVSNSGLGHPVPGGHKYGDLALQVGGVSNLRQ
jgi:hypothetical protein